LDIWRSLPIIPATFFLQSLHHRCNNYVLGYIDDETVEQVKSFAMLPFVLSLGVDDEIVSKISSSYGWVESSFKPTIYETLVSISFSHWFTIFDR
jgi:hypothetical protein